jgi:hypothetical protein
MIQSWRSLNAANLAAVTQRAPAERLCAFTLTVVLSRLRFGDGEVALLLCDAKGPHDIGPLGATARRNRVTSVHWYGRGRDRFCRAAPLAALAAYLRGNPRRHAGCDAVGWCSTLRGVDILLDGHCLGSRPAIIRNRLACGGRSITADDWRPGSRQAIQLPVGVIEHEFGPWVIAQAARVLPQKKELSATSRMTPNRPKG